MFISTQVLLCIREHNVGHHVHFVGLNGIKIRRCLHCEMCMMEGPV